MLSFRYNVILYILEQQNITRHLVNKINLMFMTVYRTKKVNNKILLKRDN